MFFVKTHCISDFPDNWKILWMWIWNIQQKIKKVLRTILTTTSPFRQQLIGFLTISIKKGSYGSKCSVHAWKLPQSFPAWQAHGFQHEHRNRSSSDGPQWYKRWSASSTHDPNTKTTNLRNLSKKLVVIGLLKVDLVIDGISHLTLAPFLWIRSDIDEMNLLSVGRLKTR